MSNCNQSSLFLSIWSFILYGLLRNRLLYNPKNFIMITQNILKCVNKDSKNMEIKEKFTSYDTVKLFKILHQKNIFNSVNSILSAIN